MSATVKSVTVLLAAFGGVVLLGTGASAAFAGVSQIGADAEASEVVEIDGVQGVDAEVNGAQLNIEFYDGDTAQLRADGGSLSGWTLRRDGEDLEVNSPRWGFEWWNPTWLRADDQPVTLLLPESLAGIDVDLTLNAGNLTVDGDFGEIDADTSAGTMALTGSARTLDLDLSAGRADVELARVDEASYTVTAGRVTSELTGAAPREVEIEVSAGNLTLTVPQGSYDVRRDESAGSLNSELSEDRGSANRISVTVSAGSVNLLEG